MTPLLETFDTAPPLPVFATVLVLAALAALGFMALLVLGARRRGAVVEVGPVDLNTEARFPSQADLNKERHE